MSVELFQVGGSVRDEIMGLEPKDFDFTVVAPGGFAEMREWLLDNGFKIFVETEEYLTIRAHFPKGFEFNGRDVSRYTGDFVLARKEGTYTDGRRPDSVVPGTLLDDLRRRDFTINALARDKDGNLYDYFGGVVDIGSMTLRAVGNAENRIREDALRAVRAIRFCITKGFKVDNELYGTLMADWLPELIAKVSLDRRREELTKCFKHDTLETMRVMGGFDVESSRLTDAIFSGGLWLEPTNKQI